MKYKDHTVLEELYDTIAENLGYRIKKSEKSKIFDVLKKHGLDGNGRFGNVSKGIARLSAALQEVGYELNMVTGDILLGEKGSRLLGYRKYSDATQPFEEHPEIVNSRISFNWELLRTDEQGDPVYEILAYPN